MKTGVNLYICPLTEVIVEGGVAPVDDPGGQGGREEGAEGDGEPSHEDLVDLLPGAQPLVGLALPLLGPVPPVDIVCQLKMIRHSESDNVGLTCK